MKVSIITIIVLLINIPFGFWREGVKKFSLKWFLAIHIPVVAIVLLRKYSGIGYELYTYVLLVSAFFGGQKLGGFLYTKKGHFIKTPSA